MWWVYLLIALAAIVALLLTIFVPLWLIARHIYRILLVRTSQEKWGRECSWDDKEQQEMFRIGIAWGEENAAAHRSVSVTSEGFRLAGEYFDFGNKKAVIIIPGRMETCAYSYYFAKPYQEMGYNVLAIDNRSHGLSEGKYNTVGLREYKDIIAWAKLLKSFGAEAIVLHGICIGGATAIYAAGDAEGKEYFNALVADGTYNNFKMMMDDRFRDRKKPVFPFVPIIMAYLKRAAGKDAVKFSPLNEISKLEIPVLFFYSKQDVFSKPENVQKLYDRCGEPKRLHWFEKGIHSHLRINAEEEYDGQIKEFFKDYV